MRGVVTAVVALLMLATPAQAHSTAEIEAWEADWRDRINELGRTGIVPELLLELVDERSDFEDRHGWYFDPPPPPKLATQTPQARSGAATVSRPPSAGGSWQGTAEPWRPLIAAYFGAETDRAVCVASWESRGNPGAISDTNDWGLFQIHVPLWSDHFGISPSSLLDPETNVRIAKAILDSRGWGSWSAVSKRGVC